MIEIKIDDRQVQSMRKKLAAKASDLKPAMRAISQIMFDAVEENFEQGGRPKWKPLSPGTIAERLRKGTWPGQILVRSAGGLAASISAHYDATSATVGTNKPYAAIHQFGGKTVFPSIAGMNRRRRSHGTFSKTAGWSGRIFLRQ